MNHRSYLAVCLVLTASAPCFAWTEVQSEAVVQGAEPSTGAAEEATPEEATVQHQRKWVYTIAPYFLFPFFQGEAELGPFEAPIEANPGDVIGALDWGIMLYFEATSPKWAASADFTYMDLGKKTQVAVGPEQRIDVDAEFDLKMLVAQFHGFRRLASWVELGLALRIVHQRVNLDAEADSALSTPGVDLGDRWTWVDPLIGARLRVPVWDKWRLSVLADFGGFYVGSDYSWQAYAYGGYLFHRVFELGVAFRALGMKYVDGSGLDRYVYDAIIFGPEIGFIFHI